MPNGKKPAGKSGGGTGFFEGPGWIWLFLIIVAAILVSGSGFFREGGIRFGSGTDEGTVEEKVAGVAPLPELSPPGEKAPSATDSTLSTLKGKLALYRGLASSANANQEYVEISAPSSNDIKIFIGGMGLGNSRGERFAIGAGAYLPYSGQVNPEEGIQLEPGGRAYIITGRSPIGTSFRPNLCAGYFQQFNKFEPRLREECPRSEDEDSTRGLQNSCLDFLETVQTCRQVLEIPLGLTPECQNYVSLEINYKKCVERHRNDPGFYSKNWYIYLGRDNEIWSSRRETITLYDREGKILDSISY